MAAPTLYEQLGEAQKEAQALREKLAHAEHGLAVAREQEDYPAAERHKKTCDELRQPVLIAEAHVQALSAGVQALEEHRRAEQRAEEERERKAQARAQYEREQAAEAEASEQLQRCFAEISAGYAAIRQVMDEAIVAEQLLDQARHNQRSTGVTAGILPPGSDVQRPNYSYAASSRFDSSPVLALIRRTLKPF